MEEKRKASAAHMRATAKYEAANYDKALIRFPKGTNDRIKAQGFTINGYVNQLVKYDPGTSPGFSYISVTRQSDSADRRGPSPVTSRINRPLRNNSRVLVKS